MNGLGQIWNEQTKLMTYITLWYLGNVYCEYYAQLRSRRPYSSATLFRLNWHRLADDQGIAHVNTLTYMRISDFSADNIYNKKALNMLGKGEGHWALAAGQVRNRFLVSTLCRSLQSQLVRLV